MAPERRLPVLMAFCVEALERTTDDAIEIYDRALGGADRAAQRKREELERRARRDTQATIRRFIDLSSVVLQALRLIRQLAGDKRRWLPGFSPSAFIDAQWRAHRWSTPLAAGLIAARIASAPPTSCAPRCGRDAVGCQAVDGTPTPPACCCPTNAGTRQGRGSPHWSNCPPSDQNGSTPSPRSSAKRCASWPEPAGTRRPRRSFADGGLVVDIDQREDEGRLRER